MAACPTCGKDLTWIPQYDRFYCYAEKKYAPKGYGTPPTTGSAIQLGGGGTESHVGHYHCPSCGRELTFIPEYDRHYCYTEKKYAPKDLAPVTLEPVVAPAPDTPSPAPMTEESPPIAEAPKVAEPELAESPAASAIPQTVTPEVFEENKRVEQETASLATAETIIRTETVASAGPELGSVSPDVLVEPAAVPETEEKGARPALKRSRVRAAKKPQLEAWSRAYDLSTKGNRESLRNRLLKYMDDQHMPDREEVTIVEAPVPAAEVAPTHETPAELPREGFESPAPEPALPEVASTAPVEPELEPSLPSVAEQESEPAEQPTPDVQSPTPTPAPEPRPLPIAEPPTGLQPEPEPKMLTPEPASEPRPEPVLTPTPERIPDLRAELPGAQPPVRVVEAARPAPREAMPSVTVEAATPTPKVAPAVKPVEPPVTRVEVSKALACPNCGRELTYISRYDRLYCFSCGRYAPKGYGRDQMAVEAPKSQAPLAVVVPTVQAAKPVEAPAKVVETRPENVCPTCGRTMRYVKEYQRWWCDAERKYAPRRVKNPCPTCSKELSYVRSYDRWYCTYEKKYAPKTYQAAVPVIVERAAPATASAAAPATPAVAQAKLAQAAAVVSVARESHAHKAPLAGIVLVVVGYVLLIVQTVMFGILPAAGMAPIVIGDLRTTLLVLGLIQLVGLTLAMVGTALGLLSLRSRTG